MQRAWIVAFAVSAALLVGCTHPARRAPLPPAPASAKAQHPAKAQPLPTDSPLAPCANPTPASPKPLDAAIAQYFADERVRTAVSLDDGAFRAAPAPPDAMPRVSAALALCNMLASPTADNDSVYRAAAKHGMSFGLGVVTVSSSVPESPAYIAAGQPEAANVQPFIARLAWIGVVTPDLVFSCPEYVGRQPFSPGSTARNAQPAYQILAIDADTGTDGIIYRAQTYGGCYGGLEPASRGPAVEFVSLPWTLVKRGPGPRSATISYQSRSCDLHSSLETVARTGQPVVVADSSQPELVTVSLERVLITCGPTVPTQILLVSAGRSSPLPRHLIHAPIGAQDIPR